MLPNNSPASSLLSTLLANPMPMPLKTSPSPPSTTSSSSYDSISSAPSSFSCSPSPSCAYPCWPNRNKLGPLSPTSAKNNNTVSSYISDEDLYSLADVHAARQDISMFSILDEESPSTIPWEETKQPPTKAPTPPHRQKLTPKRKRSTSASKTRKSMGKGMAPIAEAQE
ncbi:hypothetical protein MMC12_007978 [Toensbergia leucococca]|nr:hypothetical protein [Toensbergia leucococca]